jgi:O-glycosyl hydrolase
VLGLLALLGACSPATDPGDPLPLPPTEATIVVESGRGYQTIEGFGTTERLFDDPHVTNTFNPATGRAAVVVPPADQARILDALYVDLGLTRVRYNPRDDQGTDVAIEAVNDNDDPNVTDLSKFSFDWKKNDGHVAYVQAVRPRGVTTYFASPLTIENWMTESNPEEYVEWAMAILRRWREMGAEMPYYSILNEPGFPRGGIWSGVYLREVVKRLGARLASEGFRTRLVVPDDLNAQEALSRLQVILADPAARQYVGALAYHLYGTEGRGEVKRLSEQYNIPVWMTEYSVRDWFEWALIMHDMLANYDATAIDYMWGYFGQWERETGSYLVEIRHAGNEYTGFALTRQYYVMGQYSRFVRPGARRIQASASDPALKATAYVRAPEVVIVVINEAHRATTVGFEIRGGGPLGLARPVQTDETNDARVLPAISVTANRFQATLPARSITTVVLR